MATNNRGGNRGRSNGGRNNNPEGRNQFSGGVMDMARERPFAAAAAAAGAAAAGLFLWSRRTQISNQLSNLTDQIGEWGENMGNSWSSGDDTAGLTTSGQSGSSSRSSGSGRETRGRSSGNVSGRSGAKSTPTAE